VFVWIFHRVSGILLIFLLAFQVVTGLLQAGASSTEFVKGMADLHRYFPLNVLMVFCLIFHGLYGVRTIVLDLGATREKLVFWICTLLGVALFAAFVIFSAAVVHA
jgi:succinate dehydrogenase/fumarate reductase cytochrome b subunit